MTSMLFYTKNTKKCEFKSYILLRTSNNDHDIFLKIYTIYFICNGIFKRIKKLMCYKEIVDLTYRWESVERWYIYIFLSIFSFFSYSYLPSETFLRRTQVTNLTKNQVNNSDSIQQQEISLFKMNATFYHALNESFFEVSLSLDIWKMQCIYVC